MLFFKPDVTKKNREFILFSMFVLLDLLFAASDLIFGFGLFRAKSNLEGFVWSHRSITGLISQRDHLPRNASFWQVGLLDLTLFRIS